MSSLRVLVVHDHVAVESDPKTVADSNPTFSGSGGTQSRQVLAASANGNASFANGKFRTQPRITPRETQVLKFVAEGLTNRQIAAEMRVSVKTVEKHRQGLMNKLHIRDTAGLARYAVAQGMILQRKVSVALNQRFHTRGGYGVAMRMEPRQAKHITPREREVLKLIADGLVNKQIASELDISIKTVGNHRQG